MNILLISDVLIPTLNIGIIRPLIALRRKGIVSIRLVKNSTLKSKDIYWCDVAVFCRSQDECSYKSFLKLKKNNKKVIYDIDDNFFELPLDLPLSYYHRDSKAIFILKQFLRFSDVVTTYSQIMYDRAKQYNENVVLLNCYFDDEIIKDVHQNIKSDKLKIAYATNRSSDSNLETNLEIALAKIAQEFSDKVEIHFWKEPFSSLAGMNNVIRNMVEPNYERFLQKFYSNKYDIGLAPLLDDIFYNSKTNNKYREYAGCGVPGVYSNVQLYCNCINDSINGLLVENSSDSWYSAIKSLILSQDLRENIAYNAREDVLANYSFSNAVDSWEKLLNNIITLEQKYLDYREECNLIYIFKKGDVSFTSATYKLCNYILGLKNGFSDFNFERHCYSDFLIANKALIYYVCNGVDDDVNLLKLEESYKNIIVDSNGFQIDMSDESKKYIVHSESHLSVSICGNVIFIPKELSEDSRGDDTVKYLMNEITDMYSIPFSSKYKFKLYRLKLKVFIVSLSRKLIQTPFRFRGLHFRLILALRARIMYSTEKKKLGI